MLKATSNDEGPFFLLLGIGGIRKAKEAEKKNLDQEAMQKKRTSKI